MTKAVNLDFFAAENDQRSLIEFLLSETDVRIYESYSDFDSELREFGSLYELSNVFEIGYDKNGNGAAILLQLWSPSVMEKPTVERFSVDPNKCNGHSYRHKIIGAGLMQLYFGGICGSVLTTSHFGHQSSARAEKWGVDEDIDWMALKKVSGQIQYHVRSRLAKGKVPGRPVLAHAMEFVNEGIQLKQTIKTPWHYEPVAKKA